MRSLSPRFRTLSFVTVAAAAALVLAACAPVSPSADSAASALSEAPDPRATMEPGETAEATDRTIVGVPRPPAEVRDDVPAPSDEPEIIAPAPAPAPAPIPTRKPQAIGTPATGGNENDARPGLPTPAPTPTPSPTPAPPRALPPVGGLPDYQLGGAYDPADGVTIVGRDRHASPADGAYSICYVNGFQSQPGERDTWSDDLVVHVDGKPLIDPNWPDEVLLDTSTDEKREAILEIVRPWIEECARSGFDAVEFDNLDTFTRDGVPLELEHNLAMAREFVAVAHEVGLAAAQKNTAEHSAEMASVAGFDFALTEECAMWDECADYREVYGSAVVDIEYTDDVDAAQWAAICAHPDTPASVVLRDRNLVAHNHADYAIAYCAA